MIETEHRGYQISYSENQDVWRCHTLELEGSTLTQLKNKIGRYLAKIARASEVIPAIHALYGETFEDCFVVSLAAKTNYRGEPQVWTYKERQEKWRGEIRTVRDRKQNDASRIILDTPENRELVLEAKRLVDIARKAKDAASEFIKAIPRMDISALRLDDADTE